jgi:hypothetical protein
MYKDSPQGLWRMKYYNEIQGFIKYVTSISRNINGGGIRCPCRRCQNKKFLHPDVVMMHLLHKKFMEEYLCWYAHGEPFVPHKTMAKRMVGPTSNASYVYGVEIDNSNPYRTMVIDAMRMNQGHAGQCPIVDEESNTDTIRFFDLLKDSDHSLWVDCINHNKLLVVAQVFTVKSDYGLSEASYDIIVE